MAGTLAHDRSVRGPSTHPTHRSTLGANGVAYYHARAHVLIVLIDSAWKDIERLAACS